MRFRSKEGRKIRNQIVERDGYKYRICFEDGVKLDVHHIIPRVEGGSHEPENLVTLCVGCHRKMERKDEKKQHRLLNQAEPENNPLEFGLSASELLSLKANDELKLDIVEKLAREKVTGSHSKQVATVKNWFKSSDQDRFEDLIRELGRDTDAPVIAVGGGARDTVKLTSIPDAKEWLKDRGRDLWWL